MTSTLFQQIETEGGIVDLSARAKFRLTGGDRVRYLNGQVTNDVRAAGCEAALYACATDLKGKIVADVFIHATQEGDALLLDAEADLREVLSARLERYIIADDVELADVSDEWRLWHVFGPAAALWKASGGVGVRSMRLAAEGVDLWLPVSASPPAASFPALTEADFECYRILCGIPRHPNELGGGTFPPEAGLDEKGMSYSKGCYLGQEVLSRIRTTGKMPRELVRWHSPGPVAVGDTLFASEGDARALGTVTSAAWHPVLEEFAGLAFVKQGSAPADSKLPVATEGSTDASGKWLHIHR